ncbi:hypothetical protein [Streptomyces halobius]|uniref:Phytanoyl-CoA dioxygenase PhyH n=1 Tax=Streptomyces halobius TaxID=2879846 RepID=A0ABY4M559_9ACTN|nr:hypothetical protein [Streptomyces halobius]UQA92602.1 hypothetical protein K9S39_12895 [Streptomyces halobius]
MGQTLALQTVENFLTEEELTQLRKIVATGLGGWRPAFQAQVVEAPEEAQDILHSALERALPVLRRVLPSVRSAAPWGYTELGEGESVPAHIDGIVDPAARPRRSGRIGVVLDDADRGGGFYVETSSDPVLWDGRIAGPEDGFAPDTPLTRHLPAGTHGLQQHDQQPGWLQRAHRTRWMCDAGPGTVVAYGAQVLHGVTPVVDGRLRKFVTDLLDDTL